MPEIQYDESIKQLLQRNQTLQESIRRELRVLAQHKAQNRSWALYYTRQLRTTPQNQPEQYKTTTNAYSKRLERFFSETTHSQPAPNPDTVRRRQQLEASTFFHHTQPPWSSAQDQALQDIVRKQQQQDDAIHWDQVAQTLHKQLPNTPQRSHDECRIQYTRHDTANAHYKAWNQLVTQNRTNPPVNHPWTLSQDNLLLTYIAAAGPQHVWDTDAVVQMTTQFFPHKTRHQLFHRIHQSLLNPNYVRDIWTLQEERKLALLMKFYHESKSQQHENENSTTTQDDDDDNEDESNTRPRQNNPSLALYRASSHFARNTKNVADKWHRTLNPEQYTTRPFTPAEQQTLLRVMQENPTIGWVQLSKQHFPHRHPHRLLLQWYEQATVEAFAQREELLQQQEQPQKRKRSVAATGTDTSRPSQRTRTI